MKTAARLLLTAILCFASALSFANTPNNIAITGTSEYGFATTLGDFSIQGSGLSLSQALPDGPSFIGSCTVGAVCSLSFSPASSASFCGYCTYYSSGMLGNKTADFLDPHFSFTGSALYTGGSSLSMPMTVSGSVTGYELICNSGGCILGPKEFTVHISGQGTGRLSLNPDTHQIYGVNVSFSGIATAPEPVSLVLTATGLVGVLAKKKLARKG